MEPTSGVRFSQPNVFAPVSRHSRRCRDENGMLLLSSLSASLIRRSWSGSIFSSSANSFIADSVPNKPGTAPGPRIQMGVPKCRFTVAPVTSRLATL
jgi:hypothetical protein